LNRPEADPPTASAVQFLSTCATEIVHLGQAVMATGANVDYFVDAVFNYPTLTEAYKVAALDATNKLRTLSRLASSASGTG
jgi:NAD(P) transhydrogenase